MKSDYELQRDANIARNQAVLDALGLGGNNSLKPQKAPVAAREPAPLIPEQERRRSSRVSKQVVTFEALSHEFCDEEERVAEGRVREGRKRAAPTSYREEQAREVEEREAKAARRREEAQRVRRTMEARAARERVLTAPLVVDLPIVDENAQRPAHQFAYPVLSKRARCPGCNGIFVVTAKGTLHKHDCRPARPIVAFV